jgi:hypothetical protein
MKRCTRRCSAWHGFERDFETCHPEPKARDLGLSNC